MGRVRMGFIFPVTGIYFGDKRDYIRGFGYQGAASRQGWSRQVAELNIGADFKDAISRAGQLERWAWEDLVKLYPIMKTR